MRGKENDMKTRYLTAESVCKGHTDKLCDLIADGILDACLKEDKNSRVACEVMATKGHIFIAGEITCAKKVGLRRVAMKVISKAGYNPYDFLPHVYVHQQSVDIAGGVDKAMEVRMDKSTEDVFSSIGAGDQGTVYGYACSDTWQKLPMPVVLVNELCKNLDQAREDKSILKIGPDGKAQVTVEYQDGKPVRVKTIVVSIQHAEDKNLDELKREIITEIIYPLMDRYHMNRDAEILINPSGRFVLGGPAADTGLTGRKIMVDTYGGLASHGGGAFSGKDATKVDRSGAYMARAIAKNVVSAFLAEKCQVAISYAIGVAKPVAVEVDTFGTGVIDDDLLSVIIQEVYDLRPAAIISALNLKRPFFSETTAYGHFNGYNGTWENYDKTNELKEAVARYGKDDDTDATDTD